MDSSNKVTAAANEVSLYDNGTLVGTAPVVDGKWTAQLSGLSEGSHSLEARMADKVSERWTLLRPRAMEYLDFQDGTLGRWALSGDGFDYEIGDEQGNWFLRISTKPNVRAGFTLSPPSLPFVRGRRYRLQARYQSLFYGMTGLSMSFLSQYVFFPATTPGNWGMASLEGVYDGSSSSVSLVSEWMRAGDFIMLDDIGIYELQ